jgi:hypothetical protein
VGDAEAYAATLRTAIGPAAESLVDVARAIDAAATQDQFDAAVAVWRTAQNGLKGLAEYVAGPLGDVDLLRDRLIALFDDPAGVKLDLPFGPLDVGVYAPAALVLTTPGAASAVTTQSQLKVTTTDSSLHQLLKTITVKAGRAESFAVQA